VDKQKYETLITSTTH